MCMYFNHLRNVQAQDRLRNNKMISVVFPDANKQTE